MKVISLSKKKFQKLEPLVLSRDVLSTEARLYQFSYHGQEKVFKHLFYKSGVVFANKLYTIEMLDTHKAYLPESFYIPDSFITLNGNVEGFTVPKKQGVTLSVVLNDQRVKIKEQLYFLKKVGEILEQMEVIRKYTLLDDLFLNDLHESNFIVDFDNQSLGVVDLDSCKIGTNQAFPARYLTDDALLNNVVSKYKINDKETMGYVIANRNSDLYCYNIMVMNYLYGENMNRMDISEFYAYLNYLEDIGIHKDLLLCFEGLVLSKENKNPVRYLDSLTEQNVYRAKKMVYRKVKSRNKM